MLLHISDRRHIIKYIIIPYCFRNIEWSQGKLNIIYKVAGKMFYRSCAANIGILVTDNFHKIKAFSTSLSHIRQYK